VGKYLVFDLETQTKRTYKRVANPFNPENYVVARGWKAQGQPHAAWRYYKSKNRSTLSIGSDITVLVGANLKFDLMYELVNGNEDLRAFFKRGGKIWDIQYAEYLLKAQVDSVQMVSLNEMAGTYGGTQKIDEVKAMWEAGIETSDIPEDLLIDYLVGTEAEKRNGGDIGNTELVFLKQVVLAAQQKQTLMIEDRMDGLLSTTFMEFAGLKVDRVVAGKRLMVLSKELDEKEAELQAFIPDTPFEFNWNSNIHKSALIFGGTVKYQLRVGYNDENGQPARYKAQERWPLFRNKAVDPKRLLHDEVNDLYWFEYNGQSIWQDKFLSGPKKGMGKTRLVDVEGELKVKWQDFLYELPGYTIPQEDWKGALTDGAGNAIYSVDKDVIDELSTRNIPFLKALTDKLALDKEIGTYYIRFDPKKKEYVGMLTCVDPTDSTLHHNLNHNNTVTSRLSANNPNLQNLPRGDKSEVKKMFVSRFGDDGMMLEADYSQLEVVIQGVLSGDPQLCQDLRDKIDFHCKRVAAKIGITYEEALDWCKNEDHPDYKAGKKERTKCKIFSFQRAYGAGAPTIAYETGMDIEEVKALMETEDLLYPGVVAFNSKVAKEVEQTAVKFSAANDNGEWKSYRRGFYTAPTGTRYSFRSYDAPAFMQKRGVLDNFSPPELKNYPVQGTGGEFVQAILGLLWRHFMANDFYGGKAFLVNTVHDCVWVDAHKSVAVQVAADVKRIMESIPEFYNTRHGMSIDVPFPVEVEAGPNMHDLSHQTLIDLAEAA